MLETPHVIAGAVIATKVQNPFLAIPLAFASHFVLEKVPHWNPHINAEMSKFGKVTKKSTAIIIVDSTLALIGGSIIAFNALPNTQLMVTIFASSLVSIIPDLIEAPYFFLKFKSKKIQKWMRFQKSIQVDTTPFWGLLNQTLTVLACLWWLQK